jgi:hypothetical protein
MSNVFNSPQPNRRSFSKLEKTRLADRNKSGTEASLPNGKYWIARSPVLSNQHEVGGVFWPIEATFLTRRSSLGIHVDPNFNVDPKEDGTQGCIGTTTTME